MNKEKLGNRIMGGVAFGAMILGLCAMLSPSEAEQNNALMLNDYLSSQYITSVPESMQVQAYADHALNQPEPSVTVTMNGPTPPPQKPHFDGWVESKFYSQNKKVLAQYRAGSLDELIKVLNNQRTQQIASR